LPTVLLLDLKMPRADGFDVLRWIQTQPSLSSLIVIVLTSSEDMRDVNRAYQLGANSFLVKPMEFENAKAVGEMLRGAHGVRALPPALLFIKRAAEMKTSLKVLRRQHESLPVIALAA